MNFYQAVAKEIAFTRYKEARILIANICTVGPMPLDDVLKAVKTTKGKLDGVLANTPVVCYTNSSETIYSLSKNFVGEYRLLCPECSNATRASIELSTGKYRIVKCEDKDCANEMANRIFSMNKVLEKDGYKLKTFNFKSKRKQDVAQFPDIEDWTLDDFAKFLLAECKEHIPMFTQYKKIVIKKHLRNIYKSVQNFEEGKLKLKIFIRNAIREAAKDEKMVRLKIFGEERAYATIKGMHLPHECNKRSINCTYCNSDGKCELEADGFAKCTSKVIQHMLGNYN